MGERNHSSRGNSGRFKNGVSWLRRQRVLLVVALVASGWLAVVGVATSSPLASQPASMCPAANVVAFGPNACVFNETMSQTAIQADLNSISTQQVPITSQFDSDRYAILFEPGTYGSAADPLVFQVGYYTEIAGLGHMPKTRS